MSDKSKNKTPAKCSPSAGPSSRPQGFSTPLTPSSPVSSKTKIHGDGYFIDTAFPLGNLQHQANNFVWKRPRDICQSPQFIVDGATRMDVCQGYLCDCWFLSAVTSLSMHRPLLERVVPAGQSFQEGYTGSFVFQIHSAIPPDAAINHLNNRFITVGFIAHVAQQDVLKTAPSEADWVASLYCMMPEPPQLATPHPEEQLFQGPSEMNYKFIMQSWIFWQYGEWKEVRIDDFLPTNEGQLVYLRSSVKEEFWSSLLEKAYAKLKGGYQALNMGFPHEAMVDMTGGVTEVFSMAALPHDVGFFLDGLLKRGALINCASMQGSLEQKNKFGILFRHAYAITRVEKVKTRSGVVELVRVHNPWGNTEWEGPWSDRNGSEWQQVSKAEQQRIGRMQAEDGEFWLTVTDFCLNFDEIEVCHLTEATLSGLGAVKSWHCTLHRGCWVANLSAGGPPRGVRYWWNPQFYLTLREEDDDPSDPELTCTFLVAVMQKYKRTSGTQLAINLHIYKARSDQSYLSDSDLSLLQPLLCLDTYSLHREVVIRGRLPPGNYIIIPSTSEANQEGEFILRVLTEKGNMTVPSQKPTMDVKVPIQMQTTSPSQSVLPSIGDVQLIFKKHCHNERCGPAELFNMLKEAITAGALARSEEGLCLEHCRSFVALMDSKGLGQLDWIQFQTLWEMFRKWTDIFVLFDKNKSQSLEYSEILPALTAAGLQVDEFLIQLIGQRYTESDMTVSYPGFLSLLLKLNTMIQKFHSFDLMGMGAVSLNYRQWLYLTIYN